MNIAFPNSNLAAIEFYLPTAELNSDLATQSRLCKHASVLIEKKRLCMLANVSIKYLKTHAKIGFLFYVSCKVGLSMYFLSISAPIQTTETQLPTGWLPFCFLFTILLCFLFMFYLPRFLSYFLFTLFLYFLFIFYLPRFPTYLLLTLLLYFLFIFYLPRFPSYFIFTLLLYFFFSFYLPLFPSYLLLTYLLYLFFYLLRFPSCFPLTLFLHFLFIFYLSRFPSYFLFNLLLYFLSIFSLPLFHIFSDSLTTFLLLSPSNSMDVAIASHTTELSCMLHRELKHDVRRL